MKVAVIDEHDGEGQFPTFLAGDTVHDIQPCGEYAHWMSCEIHGFPTYVPDIFVKDSVLVREYNPTELVARKGDVLEVEDVVYAWLYAKDRQGTYGWIPAEKVISTSLK